VTHIQAQVYKCYFLTKIIPIWLPLSTENIVKTLGEKVWGYISFSKELRRCLLILEVMHMGNFNVDKTLVSPVNRKIAPNCSQEKLPS
jgi:hypothetical protein